MITCLAGAAPTALANAVTSRYSGQHSEMVSRAAAQEQENAGPDGDSVGDGPFGASRPRGRAAHRRILHLIPPPSC